MKNLKEKYLNKENVAPIWVLEPRLRQYIENVTLSLQCSKGYVLLVMIGVLSICIGNSHRIKLKEGYELFCNIYGILIGNPGTKKSVVINQVFKPLFDIQHKMSIRFSKFNNLSDIEKEKYIDKSGVFKYTNQLLISDATIEGISHSLSNGGFYGLCYVQDEFAGFIKKMNRYTNGGGDLEFFLSIWNNAINYIIRKTSEPILVRFPFLTMIGGLQPDVAHESLKFQNNGFIDRELVVIDENRKFGFSKIGIDSELYNCFRVHISKMLMKNSMYVSENRDCPKDVPLSSEASEKFFEWLKEHNDELENGGLTDKQTGAWIKQESYLGRFALIIELSKTKYLDQDCVSISAESLEKAIALVHYFKGQVFKVHELLDSKNLDNTMNRVLAWMIKKAKTSKKNEFYEFSIREIYSYKVAGLTKSDETEEILEQLSKRGDGKFTVKRTSPTSKPKTIFILNIKHFKK